MEFTGERLVPSVEGLDDLFLEHITRYMFAADVVRGLRVLDAGCGCGYGGYHLAESGADSVVGIDVSEEAINYCRKHYQLGNLRFESKDVTDTDFAAGSFDAVVAFEVFEHVSDPQEFLAEMHRVLTPDGVLIVSTPNAETYAEARHNEKNPFHIREYSPEEFMNCLRDRFRTVFWYAQSPCEGLSIVPAGREAAQRIEADARLVSPPSESSWGAPVPASVSLDGCAYMVAVCFAGSAPEGAPARAQWYSMMSDLGSGQEHRLRRVREMDGELRTRDTTIRQLQRELETRARWVEDLKMELQSRDSTIRKLQEEFEERSHWALDLDRKVAHQARVIQELNTKLSKQSRVRNSPGAFDR